jgi:AAA domain
VRAMSAIIGIAHGAISGLDGHAMSDPLTTRSALDWRKERDGAERRRPPWQAVAPAPGGEEDYGACAPSAPIDDAAPEQGPSEPIDRAHAAGKPQIIKFAPTPFAWRDPSTFPRRQFVYGRHYARKFLSVTAAQTKVGKSSLVLVEATAMASGRNLLGVREREPLRVWYWNGEDPREEIERRILAICLHYDIDPQVVEKNLCIDSGRDTEIIIATQTKTGAVIASPVEDALTTALKNGKFDVFILDPAVTVHRVSENDNMAIDAVAKAFGRIADRASSAIEAVHHTRKLGGAEATIEDTRGASAWVSAARDVRMLNRMTKDEGSQAGIEPGKERLYFRTDTDGNLAPAGATDWFRLVSVGLGNGCHEEQDSVGVASPWKWPDIFAGVTVADLDKVRARVREGKWRESPKAKNWVGYAVAEVLNLDASNRAHIARIKGMLKQWIANGALGAVEGMDEHRKQRIFIEAGSTNVAPV